jgi:hypothetical protein
LLAFVARLRERALLYASLSMVSTPLDPEGVKMRLCHRLGFGE